MACKGLTLTSTCSPASCSFFGEAGILSLFALVACSQQRSLKSMLEFGKDMVVELETCRHLDTWIKTKQPCLACATVQDVIQSKKMIEARHH